MTHEETRKAALERLAADYEARAAKLEQMARDDRENAADIRRSLAEQEPTA